MWLAFMTWLFGRRLVCFRYYHTKKIKEKMKINPGTFACEVSTKRIPVGI